MEQNLVMFDNIDQLESKTLQVTLKIHCARGLPAKCIDELKCKYCLRLPKVQVDRR